MTERLAFGGGTSGGRDDMPARPRAADAPAVTAAAPDAVVERQRSARRDWAFTGLMAFTALLFFRPQNELPFLGALHLAEIAALSGLAAMVMGRLRRGLPVTRVTPELVGVTALGAVILLTAPFAIWTGGAIGTFTDLYVKVLLIFVLLVNTLESPKRIKQFTWLIVVATGYISFRAVFDYARGINLIENGRVQGAVGGMFKNPNDLALNLVAVLPLALVLALHARRGPGRALAIGCGVLMLAAIVATHSRSGTVGLFVMVLFLAAYLVRRRPGMVFAGALALLLALPLAPSSYWQRVSSITDESADDTGSREARRILMQEAWAAFLAHPLTGVGAGQFKNYAPDGREEAWRETHNAPLQVASELGVGGLLVFGFLLTRAAMAGRQTRGLLRRALAPRTAAGHNAAAAITPDEREYLDAHAAALSASLAGWFFCALFASVAYHWTFYYLLALAVAPREILADRIAAALRPRRAPVPARFAVQEARA
jgi:O-antigen ligase